MGALATLAPWTPQDDLLLKNAVEAGASLESLAKGAVQFSRRYSFREIKDRWYSMLYDPIVSAEASAGMTNFELSASPLPSKFIKFGPSKEHKTVAAKRKAESVRASYYAMRKRICNDTFASMDLSFLVDPENENFVANGCEPLPESRMTDGETSNHFDFQGSNIDPSHYDFPENMIDGSLATNGVTTHTYYPGTEDPGEGNVPTDQKMILKEEPQVVGGKVSLNGAIEEIGVSKELAIDSFIGDDLEKIHIDAFDHINGDSGNLCSEFDGNDLFDAHELECGTSFNHLELSPLPEMPMWGTGKSIQEPNMPCDDFNDSLTCGDDYLEEISNSLFNFTDEEELYLMDVDGKGGSDKSYYDGLTSLLLSSPNNVIADQMPEKPETDSMVASEAHVLIVSDSCHAKVDDSKGSQSRHAQAAHKSESQVPSSFVKDPRFPEIANGVISCQFNTEDTEVPCNDDVFLPIRVSAATLFFSYKWPYLESKKPISSSVLDYGSSNPKSSERGKMTTGEQRNPAEPCGYSQRMGSPSFSGPIGSSKVKCEFPNSYTPHTVSRSAVIVSGCSGGNKSANTTNALIHANPKEVPTHVGTAKYLSNHVTNNCSEKPAIGSTKLTTGAKEFRNQAPPNVFGMKQEQDVALPIQDRHLQHAEVGSIDVPKSEMVANPPTLDEEEQYIESDDDVPYYSDIEAMILDMDLDPDDQDLFYSEEVSRFQHEETKRTIIRLEQGAHSYIQRAIATNEAFAILYGRHSKHYIKKDEVLIGRATEGVPVDIDLGQGGNANKISRRQAIIKMDKDGSFHIKNFGKSSILVNNKEVHTGQSQRLHSNCLIELRSMPFIFETNQSRVKQYLDHMTDNSQPCGVDCKRQQEVQ